MRNLSIVFLTLCFKYVLCNLWTKGVVHFAINKKDYDLHSREVILSTLFEIQKEICVKFFDTPGNYTATVENKLLFITNQDKRKDCPPDNYDFSGSVVDMPIGYRCLSKKDITRIVVAMLRASIQPTVSSFNSYDLIKKFRERDEEISRPGLLKPEDRNFINAHYHFECGSLAQPVPARRSFNSDNVPVMRADNMEYYESRLWPLAVVMYGVSPTLAQNNPDLQAIFHAMATIELASCVVFQNIGELDVLAAKNFLWLADNGEDLPQLGFTEGNQTVKASAMAQGAPGHVSHTLNMLLRVLGLSMMSNRYDRDNYVVVNWKNVEQGQERFFEKDPLVSWLPAIPYDFTSATHAPANYLCRDCNSAVGSQTVLPIQDHLWQRVLSMGHRTDLSESDKQMLDLLYGKQCHTRLLAKQ